MEFLQCGDDIEMQSGKMCPLQTQGGDRFLQQPEDPYTPKLHINFPSILVPEYRLYAWCLFEN